MTTYYAQAGSTNIDTASLWNTESAGGGSTLTWANLQADDILCANGKTGININVGFTCAKITTETLDGAGGGGFTISTTLTVNANIVAGTSTCLNASGAGVSVVWNGDVTGGSGGLCYGVFTSGGATWTGKGTYTGGTEALACGLYTNSYLANTIIVGDVIGKVAYGIWLGNDGTMTVTGTLGEIDGTSAVYVRAGTTFTLIGNMIYGLNGPVMRQKSTSIFYYTPATTNYTDYPTTGPARIKQYNDIPDIENVLDTDTVAGVAGTLECDDDLADNPFRSPAFG